MEEGEQKLCLAEPPLELGEKMLLQVQVQLLEEMQDMEALEAEEEGEALVGSVIMSQVILLDQEQLEVKAEREVMGAVVEQEAQEGLVLVALREQEAKEVLAVLEEEVGLAEMLGWLQVEDTIMVVMVQREAMAEAEGVVVVVMAELLALAALVALD